MLEKELLAQAQEEAKNIREAATEEARAIVHKAQEEAQKRREQAYAAYEQEREELDDKARAKARAQARKKTLQNQEKIIQEVREQAREQLETPEMYEKLFKKAKKLITPKRVVCSKQLEKTMKELAKNVVVEDMTGIRLENENESVTITINDLLDEVMEEQDILRQL